MRVVVLSNEPVLPEAHHDAVSEWAVSAAADFVIVQLARAHFDVVPLRVAGDFGQLRAELRCHPGAVVMNLFEGLSDAPNSESLVAHLLRRWGVAFTGSGGRTLALAKNKPLATVYRHRAGRSSTPRTLTSSTWHGR
jgi:hypothetical protein